MNTLLSKKIKVLLVEDDDSSSFLSTYALNKYGIKEISSVENGKDAISFVQGNCPDLIFLDLNMPLINGFEFLNFVKEQKICLLSRVVILTSSIRPVDRAKAFEYNNVISYIEKPLNKKKVEKILEDHF